MTKSGRFTGICSPVKILSSNGWLFHLSNNSVNTLWEKRFYSPGLLRKLKCFSLRLCLIFYSFDEIIGNQALKYGCFINNGWAPLERANQPVRLFFKNMCNLMLAL